ncbi:hypothetical protein BGZ83_006452 [Gryganskiella cystojenkinii]|nr:hypothetical protein BGZ83_006452 [Gryganskiella cystojenkinii]
MLTKALTGRAQQQATSAVMRDCEIFSVRLTHAGRHAGTKEAFKLGLGILDIQHLGRWVRSQMMNFYAPKNPIKDAYFMAHFNGTDESHILERDLLSSPLELWIEHVFDGHEDSIAEGWHKTCLEEMTGRDPDEIRKDDVFFEAKTDIPGAQSGLEQSAHTDKIAFLKLVSSRYIRKPPFFLLKASRVDGPDIIEAINRSASQQTVLNRTLAAMEAKYQKQLEQQHQQHEQAMALQMAQYTRLQEAHEVVLTALKEFKEMRQQLLIQFSQHPHLHPPPSQHQHFHPQPSQHFPFNLLVFMPHVNNSNNWHL